MNMQDMLKTLYKLDEAGTNAADPNGGMWADNYPEDSSSDKYDITKPQAGSSGQAAPTMQQTANKMDAQAGQPAAQNDPKKLDLLKKLNDVITQLWQLNQSSIESGKYESYRSDIAKALMESFNIFEEPAQLSPTGQRAKLVADANEIVKQLEPYKSQPDVAQALQKLQQASAAPKQTGPDLKFTATDGKIKRFQELLAKAQGMAKAGGKPISQPASPGGKPSQQQSSEKTTSTPAQTSNSTGVSSQATGKGKADEVVIDLQNALNAAGEKLTADGIIGKNTQAAMNRHPDIVSQYPEIAKTMQNVPKTATPPDNKSQQPQPQQQGLPQDQLDIMDKVNKLIDKKMG